MRILSIDGGGIRGILPGRVLVALEKKLQEKSNNTEARIADYFDLMAGTSAGGILTCLYLCPDRDNPGRPKFSAKEAVGLYEKRGDEIFYASWGRRLWSLFGKREERYSAEALEEIFEDYLKNLKLSELLKPCLITAYDIERRKAHFFRQHKAKKGDKDNFWVRDVARATSAAPTYFEPAKVKSLSNTYYGLPEYYPLIDGGMFANNPALCAYAEARIFPQKYTAKDMFILSLGTGKVKKKHKHEEAKDWGQIEWIRPALDIMMSGVSETVTYQLCQIFKSVDKPKNYKRIEPSLGNAEPDLDDASPKNIENLKEAGKKCAEDKDHVLDYVAQRLVDMSDSISNSSDAET